MNQLFLSILASVFITCIAANMGERELFIEYQKPVDEVDLNAYMGVWYQTHASLIPLKTYEKGLTCVTTIYGPVGETSLLPHLKPSPTFPLTNNGNIGGPKGDSKGGSGLAWQFDAGSPGKLVVTMANKGSVPIAGSYFILMLGPVNDDGLYDYTVVTNSLGTSLFLLARDPLKFKLVYQDDVVVELAARGFDKNWNKPIETYQGRDCVYPDYVKKAPKPKPGPKPSPAPAPGPGPGPDSDAIMFDIDE